MALAIRITLGLSLVLSTQTLMAQNWKPRNWFLPKPATTNRSTLPRITRSQFKPPKMTAPEFRMPQIQMPRMQMPQLDMPQLDMPRVSMPQWKIPRVKMPGFQRPKSPIQPVGFAKKWNESMSQTLEKTKNALSLPGLMPRPTAPKQPATLHGFLAQPRPRQLN